MGVKIILGGMAKDSAKTTLLTSEEVTVLAELSCEQHEEADTRIFAHIAFCVLQYGYTRAVIQATDTDIVVMAIYHSIRVDGLEELWVQKSGNFIPCHSIANGLAQSRRVAPSVVTSVVLGTYVLSGCDTVSYLFRHGKKRALIVALENTNSLQAIVEYGEPGKDLEATPEVIAAARIFISKVYCNSEFTGNLDSLRAHLFATRKGDLRTLPPTENAFKYHVLRSLHQIALNKRAQESNPSLPQATEFGRVLMNGTLVPKLMDKDHKPQNVKTTIYCGCTKGRCLRGCSCAKANVDCSFACKCGGLATNCGRLQSDTDSD